MHGFVFSKKVIFHSLHSNLCTSAKTSRDKYVVVLMWHIANPVGRPRYLYTKKWGDRTSLVWIITDKQHLNTS